MFPRWHWSLAALAILICLVSNGPADQNTASSRADGSGDDNTIRVAVELRDGSKLVGVVGGDTLRIQTAFGKLDIPWAGVDSVEVSEDRETAVVLCSTGDRLTGVPVLESFELETSFGKLKIPTSIVVRVSPYSQVTQPGQVLHYSFDNDKDDRVADDSGSGHTGKACNAPRSREGVQGDARSFSANNSFIQAGDLGRVEEGTICFWMNADEVSNNRCVLSTDFARGGYCIRLDEATGGEFGAGELTRYCAAEFTRSLIASNWYHVAFAWGTTRAWGYLDGQLKFELTHAGPGLPGLNLNLSDVVIGKGYSSESYRAWKGRVDEFRVFQRTLSRDEVHRIFRAEGRRVRADKERIERQARRAEEAEFADIRKRPARGLDVGLALHYRFDEDEGDTVSDSTTHRRDGRAHRTRFVSAGRCGGALQFDGNSSVDVGDTFNLDRNTPRLTVCAWMKAPPITGISGSATLISKSPEQSPWPGWGMSLNSSSRFTAGVSAGYPELFDASSAGSVCDDQWRFLSAIYELGDDRICILLYVDGEPADYSEWVGAKALPVITAPLTIGMRIPGGSGGFRGILDEVRIYTRSLAATEIAELYGLR